jgi:hypothetical protein
MNLFQNRNFTLEEDVAAVSEEHDLRELEYSVDFNKHVIAGREKANRLVLVRVHSVY